MSVTIYPAAIKLRAADGTYRDLPGFVQSGTDGAGLHFGAEDAGKFLVVDDGGGVTALSMAAWEGGRY